MLYSSDTRCPGDVKRKVIDALNLFTLVVTFGRSGKVYEPLRNQQNIYNVDGYWDQLANAKQT